MNEKYAAELFAFLQSNIQKTFACLARTLNISNFSKVLPYYNMMISCKDLFDRSRRVYIYGTGKVAMNLYQKFKILRHTPYGFIETTCEKGKIIDGIPVFSIDESDIDKSDTIIVAVGQLLRDEMFNELKTREIHNYVY